MRVKPAEFPQLRALCHNMRYDIVMDGEDALALYEREWRWIDLEKISDEERALIAFLVSKYRPKGRLRRHLRPGEHRKPEKVVDLYTTDFEAWIADQVGRLRRLAPLEYPELEGFDLEYIADELEALADRDPKQARLLEAGLDSLRERSGVYRRLAGLVDPEGTDAMMRELLERRQGAPFLAGEEGERRTQDMIRRKSENREEGS